MKNAVRILAMLLAVLLLSAMSGCEVNTTPTSPPTTEPFREVDVRCQTVPETLDNPDDLPVLNWVCVAPFRSAYTVYERSADSMNQALADRGMPFRVRFQVLTVQDSADQMMMFRQPLVQELLAKADLIYTPAWDTSIYEYLQPITQYTDGTASPSLAHTVPTKYQWMMTRRDGEIYGITCGAGIVIGNGWYVGEDLVQEGLVKPEDFQGKLFWEMDDVFAELYSKNGNQPFLYMGGDSIISHTTSKIVYPEWPFGYLANRFQTITSVYAVDYFGENGPQVVNYLDTEYTRNFLAAEQRYLKAGYCNRDSRDADVEYACVSADFIYQITMPSSRKTVYSVPAETLDFSYSTRGSFNGLAAGTTHKGEALTLLSLLGDAQFRSLMYTNENVPSDTQEQTEGPHAQLSFLTMYKAIEFDSYSSIDYPAEEGRTVIETFEDQIEKAFLRYPDEIFDYSAMDAVIEAVNAAARPYVSKFSSLTEEEYSQMLSEIEAAGGDQIRQTLQRQLDQWIEENPDWPDELMG